MKDKIKKTRRERTRCIGILNHNMGTQWGHYFILMGTRGGHGSKLWAHNGDIFEVFMYPRFCQALPDFTPSLRIKTPYALLPLLKNDTQKWGR